MVTSENQKNNLNPTKSKIKNVKKIITDILNFVDIFGCI